MIGAVIQQSQAKFLEFWITSDQIICPCWTQVISWCKLIILMFAMLTDHNFLQLTKFSISCFVIQQLCLFSHGLFLLVSAVKILFVLFMYDQWCSFNQSIHIINQLSGNDDKNINCYWTWSLVITKFIPAMDERYHGNAILIHNLVPTACAFFI